MMNKGLLIGAICVLSATAFAQLPDEINYSPYYSDYVDVRDQRDATSESLSYSRESLESILNSIIEFEEHIVVLQGQISNYQKRISYLERILPQRQSDLGQNQSELSSVESQLSQLRSRQANLQNRLQRKRRELRPLQNAIGQKEGQLREEQRKLEKVKSTKTSKVSQKQKTKSEIANADQKIAALKAQIQKLKEQKTTQIAKVSELQSKIQGLTAKVDLKKEQLQKTQMQANGLVQRFEKEKAKLAKLQTNNASPEEIKKQQQKVRTVKKALNIKREAAKTIKSEIGQINSKVAQVKSNIQSLKASIAAIPGKISNAKSKMTSFDSKKDQAKKTLVTLNADIQKLTTRIEKIKQRKLSLNREIASLDTQAQEIKERIRIITGKLQNVDRNIASNESLRSGLLNRISHLRSEIRDINDELPSLHRSISENRTDISSSRNTIAQLKQDESQARSQIHSLERELASLSNQTDVAFGQYSQRHNLYKKYLNEAKGIGQSQTNPAVGLGTDAGLAIAKSISSSNGAQIGKEYGQFQAHFIGMVRGEISGYSEGYHQGINAETSIKEGTVAGMNAGTKAAINYAQTVLKPGYFENHMQDALKGPLKINSMKMMAEFAPFVAEKQSHTIIDGLSQAEIKESLKTKTSLDPIIKLAIKNDVEMENKFKRFSKASFTYVEPNSIPYGNVICSSVYKNVGEYIQACKQAYTYMFKEKYLDNSYAEYEAQYRTMYLEKFDQVEPIVRTQNYPQKYGKAYDTSFVEAEAIGKKDAYDKAYEVSYKFSYDDTLPGASKLSDNEAKDDVSTWSAKNPVVTLVKSSYSSAVLRGGKQGYLILDLKNIGAVDSMATGSLEIQKSKNLIFSSDVIKLDSVGKKSIHQMKIPFTVNENAGSGELIDFKAKLKLPGDKYKAVRVESSLVSQILVKNPKYDAKLEFNKTPKVKGVFNYYVHSFKVNIAPMVEGLDKGYNISLKPLENASRHMSFKISQGKTGSIAKNENKVIDMSYVFKKSAKGKNIKLALEITYNGEVLKNQIIELSPR